jgi:DNA polymerase III subunit epsilon
LYVVIGLTVVDGGISHSSRLSWSIAAQPTPADRLASLLGGGERIAMVDVETTG